MREKTNVYFIADGWEPDEAQPGGPGVVAEARVSAKPF